MTLATGSRLGPYEVLSRIGAGGMGEVWKARDTRLGREVAVKVLPEELSGEKDRLRRFEQEARAASALNHPNVLTIHDIGFGLARLISPEKESGSLTAAPTLTAATEPGVVMGTVGYMSPEQVRGKPADPRSDIFSFGAVLYEMLAGRRAFRGDSAVETMSAILKEEPAAISASRSDIGPACERIVRRCLEKTPEQRFQSARDLAFALSETVAASPALPAVPERSPSRRVLVPALTAGILAVGLGALVLAVRTRGSARGVARADHPIQSLAVLPLENLSRDSAQEYFSDGMTEELIANLARIGAVRVISRTSVMAYKDTRKPLPAIARELGVDAIIEGSVMRSGEKVRITAQLIHGATDRHLWAESYQRDLRDVPAMQGEVARAIAREIEARLSPQDEKRLGRARGVDPEAHELYLKGRYALNKLTEEEIRRAIKIFSQAIAKDPMFAPACAGLSDSYSSLRSLYAAPKDVMPQAKEAARKALELDETLAEAHVSEGNIKFYYDFDWDGAEREYRRAISLNPNLAEAHDGYACFLAGMDRPGEAIPEIEQARRLDPLSLIIRTQAGSTTARAGTTGRSRRA